MRVVIGATVRAREIRNQVAGLLQQLGHEIEEVEIRKGELADYPEVAARVAQQVQQGKAQRGILIGRTGMGMCLVANKFPGVRAAACYDEVMADISRRSLDVNVLCLSADLLSEQLIERMVEIWIKAPFDGGRHARRIERISAMERTGSP